MTQTDLFQTSGPYGPEGFSYRPEAISRDLERDLMRRFETLPFEAFDFHGFKGHRQVVYFGWRYDFTRARVETAEPIPDFLEPARAVAADLAQVPPEALVQVLINRYGPGAGIGWHRDRPQFGKVVGLSLGASTPFRFRRGRPGGWDRRTVPVEARSAYLLDGEARDVWEHSLSPVATLRYSITFRTLRP
ncbi:alpha-ketoglutarate-dependent dioxygenase AlkB [Brevundimonas goettingensis]|uniref:Alpha-ketoglutarate-dependent dioxygenase AlkB n=1 Tax=Brevundimonas goettingensis TaxID=2774190 RepID=A0A975C799_9CAUL|nr:alpha-ketoglutarate-dependent dioxygenase AlkB [Brevundimonas goettingensis]QTC92872.1 alpha-ketoglutarate-dependent dioxygenase AlkB [Brevundimonas goettingensis]